MMILFKKPFNSGRSKVRFGLLAAAMLALASFTAVPQPVQAADIFRIGATQPIDSLNPFVANSDYSSVAYEYAYPLMTQYDAALKIVPYFGLSWEHSDDYKVWTFHTTPDAKWSDGEPLTARDAAFTYNMINQFRASSTARLSGWLAHLAKAEATDDNTLVLTYDQPVGHVITQLQAVPILPEHVWAEVASGDGSKISTFENATPWVSGGPFIFLKHEKDQLALFKKNPNFWGPKAPTIDGFGLQFFANDDAMVTALIHGDLDMIGEQTPPTAVEALKAAGMEVETTPSTGYKQFILNSSPHKTKNLELQDPKVRLALEMAMDRDAIVKTVWLGYATPGSTIIAPATGWHDDSIKPVPFDIAKANAILDEAGYKMGPDGIRIAGDHPMSYEMIFPTDENGAGDRTFQILQNGFKQIGIAMSARKMDADASTEAIIGADKKYSEFDMAIWNWVPPVDPEFVTSVLTCGQWENTNDSGYCNKDYDALYSQQSATLDPAERHAIINKMQKIAYEDRPYIVMNYPDVIEAHRPEWAGFVLSPLVGSVNNLTPQTLIDLHRK